MDLDILESREWESFHDYRLWEQVISWSKAEVDLVWEVEYEGRRRLLWIKEGYLVAASSEDPSENLAQVFLDQQIFSLEHYFQVSSTFGEEKSLAENLLASGLITKSESLRGDQERLFRILQGCLFLQQGRIRFGEFATEPPSFGAPVALIPALFRAFLGFEDRNWVLNQYDQHLHIGLVLQEPFPETLWRVEELAQFQAVSRYCEKGILFHDLAHRTGLPEFMLLKFLWISTQLGFLSRSILLEANDEVGEVVLPPQKPEQPMISQPANLEEPSGKRSKRFWVGLAFLIVALGLVYFFWQQASRGDSEVEGAQQTESIKQPIENSPAPEPAEPLPEEAKPLVDERHAGQKSMDDENLDAATAFWRNEAEQWKATYTLGIYMVCDPENVLVLWRKLPETKSFFVLPKSYQNQACYWVCWGRFQNRLDALAARSELPDVLAEVAPDAEAYLLEILL